jgi:hypothetical protein
MKKYVCFGAVACALVLALAGGTAQRAAADPTGNETCGGHVSLISWNFDLIQWDVHATHFCGDGKTFSWEIQQTTDGGNHWYDYTGDHGFRSGAGCNNGCSAWHYDTVTHCTTLGSYRVHFWWSGGDYATKAVGAGMVCDGDIHYN